MIFDKNGNFTFRAKLKNGIIRDVAFTISDGKIKLIELDGLRVDDERYPIPSHVMSTAHGWCVDFMCKLNKHVGLYDGVVDVEPISYTQAMGVCINQQRRKQ